MKILVILGHPKKGSFCQAIAKEAIQTLQKNKHQVIYHDLYEEKFDPVLSAEEVPKKAKLDPVIKRYCDEISEVEGIIIIHPNWWGMPPAIIKGWLDRVFRPGVAYEFAEGDSGEGVPVGLLRAKTALVFNTSNTPKGRELRVYGDPLERLWGDCVFDLCGVKKFYRKMYGVMVISTPKQRKKWLRDVKRIVVKYFPSEI